MLPENIHPATEVTGICKIKQTFYIHTNILLTVLCSNQKKKKCCKEFGFKEGKKSGLDLKEENR